MLLNQATFTAIYRAAYTHFQNAFTAATTKYERIATVVPSSTKTNDYGFLGKITKMRKWVGEKTLNKLKLSTYSLTNDDFEGTIEIDRNDIEDDNLGMVSIDAAGVGESAKQLPDDLVFGLMGAAFTTACYDGQYYIDDDHPSEDANGITISWSNKMTKALSADSFVKAKASFGAAKTMMRTFTADGGIELELEPDILLVPPALEDVAKLLMMTEKFADQTANPYKNACEVMVSAKIKNPTQWFLLATKRPLKPIIFQERKKPVFVSATDPQSTKVFMEKKYLFGAEARGAVGFGLPQCCVGSTGTDNT